jgi:hypothetical protein
VIAAFVAATVAATAVSPSTVVTPMYERIAHLAALNKRNGQTQEFAVRPGESIRFATLTVTVRACETTPAWEARQTAAYLRIDDAPVQVRTSSARRTHRVFSGWMFAESPSLNPLEHPLYDVWVRSCTMRFPDTGPDTVVAGRSATSQSSAAKSPAALSAAASKPL